ncbi:MAG: acyltransferase [Candidatus Omnitrophica bacterium]|nr:acyltransferase [Candidatus Omnitrophota bacterium]
MSVNCEKKQRNSSIDTLRVFAIFYVVLLHTQPFHHSSEYYGLGIYKNLYVLIDCIGFAVPFFCMISGYFFGKKLLSGEPVIALTKRYCKRLFQIFVLWSIVYAFYSPLWLKDMCEYGFLRGVYWNFLRMTDVFKGHVAGAIEEPCRYIMMGTSYQLWFLTALIIGLMFLAFFIYVKKEKFIIPGAMSLYIVGILGKRYSVLPLLGYDIASEDLLGPLLITIFVATGWRLSKMKNYSTRLAVCLVVGGGILRFLELFFLWKFYEVEPSYAYLLSTIPLATGVFMLALQYPTVGANSIFPKLGRLTLGVYVLHVLILDAFFVFREPFFSPLAWDLLFPLVAYGLAILTTLILQKIPVARIFVT